METSVTTGNMDTHQSISEILDSCVIYYYAVAHKYITMVNDMGYRCSWNLISYSFDQNRSPI